MARKLVAAFRVPTRRACGVVQCDRATFYYGNQRRGVTPLPMRLRETRRRPVHHDLQLRLAHQPVIVQIGTPRIPRSPPAPRTRSLCALAS